MEPTTDAAAIAAGIEYILKRGHSSLLVLFGVYPQKRKIHVLTNNDLEMLRREYKRYAMMDLLRGEKQVIQVEFTDYEVHRYQEIRIANDGNSYSKAEFIERYGILRGEWYWDKARSSAW